MFQVFDTWKFVKGMLYRIMIVYFVTSFFKSIWFFFLDVYYNVSDDYTPIADFMSGRSGGVGYNNTGVQGRGSALPSRNLFQPGQKFDLYLFISDSVCFKCGAWSFCFFIQKICL